MKRGITVYFNDKNGNKSSAWRSFSGSLEDGFDILVNNRVNSMCITDGWDEKYGLPDNNAVSYWHWGNGVVAVLDNRGNKIGKFQKIGGKWAQTEKNGLPAEDTERTDRILAKPVEMAEEIPMAV